jgi:hypothetical protein
VQQLLPSKAVTLRVKLVIEVSKVAQQSFCFNYSISRCNCSIIYIIVWFPSGSPILSFKLFMILFKFSIYYLSNLKLTKESPGEESSSAIFILLGL